MGLLDLLKPRRRDVIVTKSALEEARENSDERGAITRLIESLLRIGIDGRGPFDSAIGVAEKALRGASGERAIDRIVRQHVLGGAAGGFATSLGGFVTMPVALPVNVFEFYVQATRMVAAIARVRGYDVEKDEIRSAILLTLVGAKADDILAKAGAATGGGRLTTLALSRLPKSALMIINKAVGFRLLRTVGEKTLARFGRAVPLAGGVVGGAVDWYMMSRIAEHARREFPQQR